MEPREYMKWVLEVALDRPVRAYASDSPVRDLVRCANGEIDPMDLSPMAIVAFEQMEEMIESGDVISYSEPISKRPDLKLLPSRKNPKVRRWQRPSSAKSSDGSVKATVKEDDGGKPEDLLEVLSGSKHTGALQYVANTKLTVKSGKLAQLAMATPYYDPDRNVIAIHESHLEPQWFEKYGVKYPHQVVMHEFAHAWDYGVAHEKGHPGKSYWVSEVAPKFVSVVKEPPPWMFEKGFERFARMVDLSEWPAVLTEMLYEPEKFEAVRRWFKEVNPKLDLAQELNAFYGAPVAPKKVDEKKVEKLLKKMKQAKPKAKKKVRWVVPYKDIAYAGVGVYEDPGFMDLEDLLDYGEPYDLPLTGWFGLEEEESENDGEERY